MYLEYWGFEKFPFNNVPDPDFFYMSKPHEEGLSRLIYTVEMNKGCGLLSGDVGCGKTLLSKVFTQKISDDKHDIALISNPSLDPKEFLQDILYKFQINQPAETKSEILRSLNDKLTGNLRENKESILIVDEAQRLTEDTLEEIRLLLNYQISNRFLLTILLLGQPEVMEKIKNIKQLEQRIPIKYFLRPFGLEETANYILFRQKRAGADKNVFYRQAIELIYKHTNGLPRLINNLCDLAFLIGFGEKKKMITSNIIQDIIEDGTIF
jgi:general secretion pathway protein A